MQNRWCVYSETGAKRSTAILVSNVPSGTWVGVKNLPKGRGTGEGGVGGRRRLPHPTTISLSASLLSKLKPRGPQDTAFDLDDLTEKQGIVL